MFNERETRNGCICQKDNDEKHVSSLVVIQTFIISYLRLAPERVEKGCKKGEVRKGEEGTILIKMSR